MILIKKVYLRNFVSHRESELSFDRGVTALVGPNGAGKSSIVEAIYFALTGDVLRTESRRGGRSKWGVVNDRAKEGEAVVRLWLDVNGEEVVIERRCFKQSIRSRPVDHRVLRNGRTVAVSAKQVDKVVSEILGISTQSLKEIVRSALVVPQGEITRLLTARPAERKERLDKLLGLEAYEKARESLDNYSLNMELSDGTHLTLYPKRRSLDTLRMTYLSKLSELGRKREKLKSIEDEINSLTKDVEELSSRRKSLEDELRRVKEGIEKVYGELIKLKTQGEGADELRRKIKELRSKEEELSNELMRCLEAEKRIKVIESKLGIKEVISKARKLRESSTQLRSELDRVNTELERDKEIVNEIKRIKSKYPKDIEEVLQELKEAVSKESKLVSTRKELENERSELIRRKGVLEATISRIKRKIEEVLSNASGVVKERFNSAVEALKLISKYLSEVEDEVNELSNKYSELNRELSVIESRIDDVKGKLRYLKGAKELSKCPLCQQPLTPRLRDELVRNLESELSRLKELIPKINDLLIDTKRRKEEKEALLNRLREVKVRLRDIVEDESRLSDLETELNELISKLGHVKNKLTEIDDEIKKVIELRTKLAEVESDYQRLKELMSKGVKEELISELERRREEISNELRRVEDELSSSIKLIEQVLGTDDLEEAEELISELENELSKLRELLARKEHLERLIKDIKKEIEEKEEELRRKEEAIRRSKELGRIYEGLKSKLDHVEDELKRINDELVSKETMIKSLRKERDELVEGINGLSNDLSKLRDAWRKLHILNWIKDKVFHKDGVPKLLRKELIRSVELLMKKYLEYFNLAYSDVRIDEDLNITLLGGGIEVGASRLSGGELVAASIALILSLHQAVLKGRLGFLVLDEPTIHLDEDRTKSLMEIVKNFRGGGIIPQLIVVTHHNEVRDASDTVYEVSKDVFSVVREVT